MVMEEAGALRAEGVGVVIGERALLDGVNVVARGGELTALLGPNGAGKSTLLRVLAGVRAPTSGAVWLGEERVDTLSARALARRRALMPQYAAGSGLEMTTLELALLGRHARRGRFGMTTRADITRARAVLESLGLGAVILASAHTLSGGERRRVMLARVLLSDTPWWLLDEPTAHLDLQHKRDTMERARAHCAAGGGALVVVHDLNIAERYADRVLLLRGGRLVAAGSTREVFDAPTIHDTFGVPLRPVDTPAGRTWAWPATGQNEG